MVKPPVVKPPVKPPVVKPPVKTSPPTCKTGHILSADKKSCTLPPVTCTSAQVKSADGKSCTLKPIVCAAGQVKSKDGKTCTLAPIICKSNQTKSADGKSCQLTKVCPKYTKPQNNNTFCGQDKCTATQIVQVDGTCKACGTHSEPDDSKRNCKYKAPVVVCKDKQILSKDGKKCVTCPAYSRQQISTDSSKVAKQFCGNDKCTMK